MSIEKREDREQDHLQEVSPVTAALHTKVDASQALPVATPLFQCSAFQTGSPYFYTRKANPNSEEFENVVKTLEGAKHALAVTTGMTALSMVLNLLKAGQTLVVNKDIYGCSFKYFQRVAKRRDLRLKILDLSKPAEILEIPNETQMVIFETPTNPFLKTIDIQNVALHVKKHNPDALIVVDNTWATPLYQRPLEWGADISLHSATKYFSGHSDVMGGIILCDRGDLDDDLRQERFYTGAILDPHSAWLLCRSLQTFALRMREHQKVTLEMVEFLNGQSQIKKVYYPAVDRRQLTGYGGIVFFEFQAEFKDAYAQFVNHLKLFSTGTGMAAVTSMVAQPFSGSHASMNAEEKEAMGLGKELVRLCFGFEDPRDLKNDLHQAFSKLEPARKLNPLSNDALV